MPDRSHPSLGDDDYARLLGLRTGLRRFLRWSEDECRDAGITPAQHQLMLAIRGLPGNAPTIGEIAEVLLLRHHSVVGLVDRAEEASLVKRWADDADHRLVRIRLTPQGARRLEALAAEHVEELARRGLRYGDLSEGLGG